MVKDFENIFENDELIIITKKPGVPSQPDKTGDESILEKVEKYLRNTAYIVNRLDRPVGGLMVIAKSNKSANYYREVFKKKLIQKKYLAVVYGDMQNNEEVRNYLLKNQRANISKIVPKGTNKSKEAILFYKKIASAFDNYGNKLSLLEINLETGRHHQIRVQMQGLGHPILGDTKYGKVKYENFVNLGLWCHFLEFKSMDGKILSFTALPVAYEPFTYFCL